uniref:Uncharacterized protein n=1 Tax=viral metagenome TaxID=1070528 RepID=A0A6M3IJ68_9ZZZZ
MAEYGMPNHVRLNPTQFWEYVGDTEVFDQQARSTRIYFAENPEFDGDKVSEVVWADVAHWLAGYADEPENPGQRLIQDGLKKAQFVRRRDLEKVRQTQDLIDALVAEPEAVAKALAPFLLEEMQDDIAALVKSQQPGRRGPRRSTSAPAEEVDPTTE